MPTYLAQILKIVLISVQTTLQQAQVNNRPHLLPELMCLTESHLGLRIRISVVTIEVIFLIAFTCTNTSK